MLVVEQSEGFSAGSGIRKGWFSNTSFTTGLKTLPTFRPDALVFFRANNPVVKLVLENQPFLVVEHSFLVMCTNVCDSSFLF